MMEVRGKMPSNDIEVVVLETFISRRSIDRAMEPGIFNVDFDST